MRVAEAISAPKAGKAEQAPRSLTFFDLPSETQNEIIKQVSSPPPINLSQLGRRPAVGRVPRSYGESWGSKDS